MPYEVHSGSVRRRPLDVSLWARWCDNYNSITCSQPVIFHLLPPAVQSFHPAFPLSLRTIRGYQMSSFLSAGSRRIRCFYWQLCRGKGGLQGAACKKLSAWLRYRARSPGQHDSALGAVRGTDEPAIKLPAASGLMQNVCWGLRCCGKRAAERRGRVYVFRTRPGLELLYYGGEVLCEIGGGSCV